MSTIAAISTAPGIGGIGIIRISGEETYNIIQEIFKPKKQIKWEEIKGYSIKYGYIMENEEIVDEVLVSFFRKPNTYTTEDLCEIHSHGGDYIVRKILEICMQNGAELAEPGEFTKRAFLNGRIDLAQSEAIMELIQAKTEKEAKTSMEQLKGFLSEKIQKIQSKLRELMVQIEVSIDYPEYDVEEIEIKKARKIILEIEEELKKLIDSFENGKIIKEGIKVALIGKPNVGKSSLLNAILKEDRAIVTEIEGTTRDTIEEAITIGGVPIHIIDTAGIRDTTNQVEQIGIKKSKEMVEQADLVLAILDSSKKLEEEDREILRLLKNKKSILLLNKIDIKEQELKKEDIQREVKEIKILSISAKEKEGIEELNQEIIDLFKINEIGIDNTPVITNLRHKDKIQKAKQQLEEAIQIMDQNLPIDICAISLKNAMDELGSITGESVSEDIIKEIFSKFCLGK